MVLFHWPSFCPLTHQLPLLRAFACAVTSILNILPWLGLVGSFLISFPPLIGLILREAFLDFLWWLLLIAPQMYFLPFSTQFYVLRGTERLPCPLASSWVQKVRGWREVGVFTPWAPSLMSHTGGLCTSTESFCQGIVSYNHRQLPPLALLG